MSVVADFPAMEIVKPGTGALVTKSVITPLSEDSDCESSCLRGESLFGDPDV